MGNHANVDDTNDKVMIAQKGMDKKKGGMLKNKVVAVTKLMRMYKVLKENQNNIVQLKQLSPNGMIPHGVLAGGSKEIEKVIASFNSARKADLVNEANPNAKPNKNNKNIKGKVAFFKQNMDKVKEQKSDDSKDASGGRKRRKMTITKEDAPPPSQPKYGALKEQK